MSKQETNNQNAASIGAYVKIARPDHWVKNAFILPGLVLALILIQMPDSWGLFALKLVAGFFATCFIASANYVINEWLDAEFDKYHPTKKNRPVVSQNMKFSLVMAEYAICIVVGVGLSLVVNIPFLLTELWLLVMGVLYNVKPIRTKDIVYLDVLSESINNMIRLLLGWFIVCDDLYPPSSILLGYWLGGAFLMAVKRYAEYRMIGDPKLAGSYRKSFAKYTEETLLCSSFFYALCATFLIGIFLLKYSIFLPSAFLKTEHAAVFPNGISPYTEAGFLPYLSRQCFRMVLVVPDSAAREFIILMFSAVNQCQPSVRHPYDRPG